MLKITGIRIPAAFGASALKPEIAALVHVKQAQIRALRILRRSVDSRKKSNVHFLYTVAAELDDEASVLRRNLPFVSPYVPETYAFPYSGMTASQPPVIVGAGPAGLFAALCLAEAGVRCILLERGRDVDRRCADVARFWHTGVLNERSNVQFGEGGAGTFSDGKLTTGVHDRRVRFVFETFVRYGAPEDILYLAKPHIGTDRLREVVKAMRSRLVQLGCDVRFEHRMTGLECADGALTALYVRSPEKNYLLPARQLILAPGNSARDTFAALQAAGLPLEPKNFAIGVRIEHRQTDIDAAQYGQAATLGTLPVSDYKLAAHLPDGRSVYTFCVCPGGSVVASSSEHGGVVTNGMSEYARDGENCNGGLLVSVTAEDFEPGPLGGVALQRRLEAAAYRSGGGDYRAPAQLVGDFLARRPSEKLGRVKPTYRPGVRLCNLWDVLPEYICRSLAAALPEMGRKIRGFDAADAVLTAVETRSSSPVRILRGESCMSAVRGIYPCGEGAGYAGGIVSAAVDGIRCAEAVCEALIQKQDENTEESL